MSPSLSLAVELIGAFGAFYFGMKTFLESLQILFEKTLRKSLARLTHRPMTSFLVGAVVTFLVQSSSTSMASAMGLANAGLMNLVQILYFNLGALLATTATSWGLSLFSVVSGLPIIAFGLILRVFSTREKFIETGKLFVGLGLVFVGLQLVERVADVVHLESALEPFGAFGRYGFILLGIFLTFVLESSAMTFGFVLALFMAKSIGFESSLLSLLGASLGTTLPPLKAAFERGSVLVRRACLSHFMLKLVGCFFALIFIHKWMEWSLNLVETASSPFLLPLSLTLLNAGFVVFFAPFNSTVGKMASVLLKNKKVKEPQRLLIFGGHETLSTSLSLEIARQEIRKLVAMLQTVIGLTKECLAGSSENEELLAKVEKYEEITDNVQKEVVTFLQKVMVARMSGEQSSTVYSLLKVCDDLELIADRCLKIIRLVRRKPNGDYREYLVSLEIVSLQYERVFASIMNEEAGASAAVEGGRLDLDDSEYVVAQIAAIQKSIKSLVETHRSVSHRI